MRQIHLILDGYNLVHRARGGFKRGNWPIVFNFFRGLRPFVERYRPKDVSIVLEGTPKRSLKLLPEYKANRTDAPLDFTLQKDAIISVLRRMPITLAWHADFEADDVVHNLINRVDPTDHVVVVSSDSDFIQLLQRPTGPSITVYNWREKLDRDVPAYDYVKWKALRGDPTDNIPKCPKMTDRTALEVVKDSNRLEELLKDAEFLKAYERNLKLIKLHDFTELEWMRVKIEPGVPDWDYVRRRLKEFGFESMTKEASWTKYISVFKKLEET